MSFFPSENNPNPSHFCNQVCCFSENKFYVKVGNKYEDFLTRSSTIFCTHCRSSLLLKTLLFHLHNLSPHFIVSLPFSSKFQRPSLISWMFPLTVLAMKSGLHGFTTPQIQSENRRNNKQTKTQRALPSKADTETMTAVQAGHATAILHIGTFSYSLKPKIIWKYFLCTKGI